TACTPTCCSAPPAARPSAPSACPGRPAPSAPSRRSPPGPIRPRRSACMTCSAAGGRRPPAKGCTCTSTRGDGPGPPKAPSGHEPGGDVKASPLPEECPLSTPPHLPPPEILPHRRFFDHLGVCQGPPVVGCVAPLLAILFAVPYNAGCDAIQAASSQR